MSFLSKKPKILKNGLIDIEVERREIVAIYETGEVFFSTGKQFHPFVNEAQKMVKETFRKQPQMVQQSPSQVLGHYDNADTAEESKTEAYERTADRILKDAANAKTSDIKIIRTPERTVVRFMIAGQEIDYSMQITSNEGNALISYIFDARDEGAGHSTKMQGEFQGFSVSTSKTGGGLTLPANVLKLRCQKGFHETSSEIMDHLVIRVFYRETDEMASLESLGLDPEVLGGLQRARDGMKGAVMIGGETGDGKSTTIISAIKRQYEEQEGKISIVTVEDPVEYKLDEAGIVQIPIQSSGDAGKRTENYRAALMHFVRINPHVGVVSEVRDAEAARQVLQFIETGHQVWTTIHINNVNSIPFRLIDMGIEPTELSKPDSLKLMLKQTLVPLLCVCSKKGEEGFQHRNVDGCPVCKSSARGPEAAKAWAGFQRLVAVAEMIEPDDEYLKLIRANDAIGAKSHWTGPKEQGGMSGITLAEKLNMLVKMGAVDPKSIIKKGAAIEDPGEKMTDVYREWIQGLLDNRKTETAG
jgi:type II secretory ATPase GspE/PulE/Tfp pilus assembly ATPase PilB-like protein